MFRQAVSSDRPGIVSLWQQAFGDSEAWILDFFRAFPRCISYVAEEEGQPVCAIHVLPQVFSPDLLCGYLYALSTEEGHRGRGLAAGLLAFAEADLQRRGIDCTVLRPGEPSLFGFYERLGYAPVLTRRETPFSGGERISAEAYLSLRERTLTVPHVMWDLQTLRYLEEACGAVFYRTAGGCAAVTESGPLEVLPGDQGGAPWAMVKWLTNSRPISGGYLGFALD